MSLLTGPSGSTPSRDRGRWYWLAVSLALVSVPFLFVDFIPCTDLPQHLGQLRLFADAWQDPGAPLRIQWWTPYGLVYLLLALPWAVLSPVAAGRVGVLLLVLLQVGALHVAAARHARPAVGAFLATAFVFNALLYWGFLNFIFGSIVFLVWFELVRSEPRTEGPGWNGSGWKTSGLFLLMATTLFLSHALWFGIGVAVFGFAMLCDLWADLRALGRDEEGRARLLDRIRPWAWRLGGLAPVLICAFWWFTYLKSSSFGGATVSAAGPLARLDLRAVVAFALGGLLHPIEVAIVLIALLWIVAALFGHRREPAWGCDRGLLGLALLFFLLYVFLPDKYTNTIRFSVRWLPYAFIAMILAVGAPPWRRWLRATVAIAVVVSLVLVTTVYWQYYEERELDGLSEALAALPPEPRVIGLSYLATSDYVTGTPFIQIFAWAQVLRGGELNFSFGDFTPSLVVYDPPDRWEWTDGLEWLPMNVRRSDFRHFDYALVSGNEKAHAHMAGLAELEPVVAEGPWRLYRVTAAAAGD